MIDISEIFYSIQGESTYSGLPFIFVRFAGCNLRCNYCDAKYSYTPEKKLTIDEILNRILQFKPTKHILITGGEPLLQKEIYTLFSKLHSSNYTILLETNGSISLKNVPEYVIKIVDIKCPDSGEGNSFYPDNLNYVNLKKDQIKFVISSDSDYQWSKNFIVSKGLFGQNVLFSAAWGIYPYIKLVNNILNDKLDVRFQPQIHKFIWPADKKGV